MLILDFCDYKKEILLSKIKKIKIQKVMKNIFDVNYYNGILPQLSFILLKKLKHLVIKHQIISLKVNAFMRKKFGRKYPDYYCC